MSLGRQQRRGVSHTLIWICILVGIIATTTSEPASSQPFEFQEFHTWTDAATIYYFTDNFRYDGDYGVRGLLNTRDDWWLIYLRPSVRYQTSSWMRLHGGMALFYNFFETVEDLPELRPWVGVMFVGPKPGGWLISNYFRLEYRDFYIKNESSWEGVWRGRWQLQLATPRFAIGSAQQFRAVGSVEPFTDFGASPTNNITDRIRINFGIEKRVTPALRISLNYLFHTVRVTESGEDFDLDDHVVRLRFFYRFN